VIRFSLLAMVFAAFAAVQSSTIQPQTPQPPTTQPSAVQPPATPPMQLTDENRSMMLTLLNRIETLTGKIKDDNKNKSGRVTVERATLDEIAADIVQVKMILQK